MLFRSDRVGNRGTADRRMRTRGSACRRIVFSWTLEAKSVCGRPPTGRSPARQERIGRWGLKALRSATGIEGTHASRDRVHSPGSNSDVLVSTSGQILRSPLTNASPARSNSSTGIGDNLSITNQKFRLAGDKAVRRHCRQFHLGQVMPLSSHQTTSPCSGFSTTGAPLRVVSKLSEPAANPRRGEPA